ncbi:10213_t:CDS:2, partial [Gigaspora rosea]
MYNSLKQFQTILPLEKGIGYSLEKLPHQGCKNVLIERLAGRVVNKTKDKDRAEGSSQRSGKGNGKPQEWVILDVHYIVLKRLLKKSMQATLEKVVGEMVFSKMNGS